MANVYSKQIEELQKLSFQFYFSIAKSKEPLTFTFVDSESTEHQCEVFFDNISDDELIVYFGFDSEWQARFKETSNTYGYALSSKDEWADIKKDA